MDELKNKLGRFNEAQWVQNNFILPACLSFYMPGMEKIADGMRADASWCIDHQLADHFQ